MNLGEYYKNRSVSPEGLYQEVKSRFLSHKILKGPSKAETQQLENFLNDVIYSNNSEYEGLKTKITNLVKKRYEEKFNIELQNLENNLTLRDSVGYSGINRMDNIDVIIRGIYDNSLAKNKTASKVALERRLNQVQIAMQNIAENPNKFSIEKISKIRNDLITLESLLEELLAGNFSYIQGGSQVIKLRDHAGSIIDEKLYSKVLQIDALYRGISSIGSGTFTDQELGFVNEAIIGALSDDVNELSDKQAEDLLNEKLTGTQTRESGNFIKCKYTIGKNNKNIGKISGSGKNKILTISDTVFPGGKFEFRYNSSFRPNSDVQGKMDINFVLGGEEKTPFRISAKNWLSLGNRDFGTTQLPYAIIRSTNFDSFTNYLYVMQDEYIQLKQAHDFAKLCVLLDTVMGLSQGTTFADTLAINERGVKYHVYSVKEIIQNALQKDFSVNGYNDGYVHQNIVNLRRAIANKRGRSASFQYYTTKYTQSLMVSISYSTVSNLA